MAVAHPFGVCVRCRFKRIGCVRTIKVNVKFILKCEEELFTFLFILTHFPFLSYICNLMHHHILRDKVANSFRILNCNLCEHTYLKKKL